MLLVENDQDRAAAIARDFGRNGLIVTVAHTLAESCTTLRAGADFDVVILELDLPDGQGQALLPMLEEGRRQPVLIITSSSLSELSPDVFEYRPVVLPKPIGTSALIHIVRTVAAGYTRQSIRHFIRRFDLTTREEQTIGLLAQGHGAKEIARRLRCSEKTIYYHIGRICQKARCRDYHHLISRLFVFACQALGRTPPEYVAFGDTRSFSSQS